MLFCLLVTGQAKSRISYYDASVFPNPEVAKVFQILVTVRGWNPQLSAYAVKAADDIVAAGIPGRACAILRAAERIGDAVHEIETAKGYVPCQTTIT